ncbi:MULTISPECIES: DUF2975 domain-containing protein [Chryseobacterium]|uniref:DUF2975 domain-containing protein n=1 Tax=Candidatus Chryseobacterium massiliense TaxID=204089 RepID=A0A3D9ALQ8_9FLAO|nr:MULTISPECIES: DUF2975 domain-containing protein [Chryseobacterium]REC42095.1 hypothetical protein DRF68_18015 [Candidatus Chryseobacterium massiliae]
MKNYSSTILSILTTLLWLYLIISYITIFLLAILLITKIVGIDVGVLSKIKIDSKRLHIQDIQSLKKEVSIVILFMTIILGILQTILFSNVLKLANKIQMKSPFSLEIYKIISKIANYTLALGCFSVISDTITEALLNKVTFNFSIDNQNFQLFLVSAIIYIVSQVYKQAVDLKTENDLTI